MIQPNELRIGNVLIDHTGIKNIVKAIGVGWVKFIDDGTCAFDLAKGVLITHEILEKSGYEYIKEYAVWGNKISLGERVDMEGFVLTDFFNDWTVRPFLYLHELQNVYFLLTGEELKIEL